MDYTNQSNNISKSQPREKQMYGYPKKCPVCGSSRISVSKVGFKCRKCSFTNDKGFKE